VRTLGFVPAVNSKGSGSSEGLYLMLALAAGLSRREQQQIEAIALFINGQGPRSYALIREHLGDYPRDILVLRVAQRLFSLGCSGAGVASFPAPLLALMQGVASSYGDDWAFLGQYALRTTKQDT